MMLRVLRPMLSTAEENRQGIGRALIFAWLFLTTILVKVEGQEGVFPFHRIAMFLALPASVVWGVKGILRSRFSVAQWLLLSVLFYLIAYPFLTMLFGTLSERNLKDAAYTVSIYAVLVFSLKGCFTKRSGVLDVPAIGWFCVAFALVEVGFALALRAGAQLPLGFGVTFVQQPWLDGRLHGLMGSPSHLAPVLAMAGLFLLTRRPMVMSTFAMALLFIGLVMTGSRSGLLGCCAAAALFAAMRAPGMRISARRLAQGSLVVVFLFVFLFVVLYSSADRAVDVIQMAVRVDPPTWERSRFVIWTSKLTEFAQSSVIAQMFGAGYRAEASTFNMNVEILMNQGFAYCVVFNALYLVMIGRLMQRSVVARDLDSAFLVMVAAFTYVFSQGLSFILHEFVTFVHLAVAIVFIAYFERLSPVHGAATVDRDQQAVPRRSCLSEPLLTD